MQASSAVLLCGNVPLACYSVESFQVFKITVKDKNLFKNTNSGLGALNKVSEMGPWYIVSSCWRACLLNICNTI